MSATAPHRDIPVVGPVLNKIFGTRNERFVKKYTQRVMAISDLEPQVRALTDAQLRAKLKEFRERLKAGEKLSDVMDEALAVAREGMDRAVGIRNIFNPERGFDPARLPEKLRPLYDQTLAEMNALPPAVPVSALKEPSQEAMAAAREHEAYLGSEQPVPGWQQADIPNELYEAVRELFPESRPPFRARPFDVQLIGSMVLSQGKIAEMKTGEGKTIVGPLAAYLAAIEGRKVHVVTVNDYLVQRDRDWVFPFFKALGLTVGAIHPMHMQPEWIKREMYRCDVVYGTTSEFGFDYLRDNMKRSLESQVQRVREFAIVDEVDSILIDEARTPLIISGEAHEDQPRYELADKLARHLVEKQRPWQQADEKLTRCKERIKGLEGDIRNARDRSRIPELEKQLEEAKAQLPELEIEREKHVQYYEIELDRRQAFLTHDGIAEAQRVAQIGSFYVGGNIDMPHLLEQAIRAHTVYQRDKDYIVMPTENPRSGRLEPSIVIVDTFTGRPMIGRQWSDGLHQAIEVKEAVPVRQETQTVATITIQNFFKMYKRLAGMTGTADTEAQEFHDIYGLDVVSIPTNVPVVRGDHADLMFLTGKDKWQFIVDEIKAFHDVGRPVLVGTTSVEKSETLSQMLTRKHGIKHEVLNAKPENIEREANIVENAGQLGSVMIATNMAGRGTDIKLGKVTREQLLEHWLRRGICSRGLSVDASEEQLRENVYRKIAPKELDIQKREAEEMPFDELELRLLRHWAATHTMMTDKKIESAGAEELRQALDATGRILLHRIRWFENVEDLGGLHVIGTERHESRRIDNQLRGRSGRQGDNGSSRFFVSCEDDLMKMFAGETLMKVLPRLGFKEGDFIDSKMLSKRIEGAQRKVEERNFQYRKNILEYDEVMEHQRQAFYGMRQRVLEGRDVKGLIFEFITEAVGDAVADYLSPLYAAQCAAEYANNVLEAQIVPERLVGREYEEMLDRIRKDAKEDAKNAISVTIGEYMPTSGSDVEVEFDVAGLAAWARDQFGVELDIAELRERGPGERKRLEDTLADAAAAKIDAADLSGIREYVASGYGVSKLVEWADRKFGIKLAAEEISKAQDDGGVEAVEELIVKRAEELYNKREIEYPVEFAMDMAMAMMRQNPAQGAQYLINWANLRFNMGWTLESLRAIPPQQARQQLNDASKKFVEENAIGKAMDEAAAICMDDEALASFFRERLGAPEVPFDIRRLADREDREPAVRARVESVLRAELLYFERTMLLEVLDGIWKDHLYAMDQLRGSISFRAVSQQDPRIEFKREGSRLFKNMHEAIRDKISDYVFKLKLSPRLPGGQGVRPQAPMRPAPAAQPRPAVSTGTGTSADMYPAPATPVPGVIAGPGLGPVVAGAPAGGGAQPAPAAAASPPSAESTETPPSQPSPPPMPEPPPMPAAPPAGAVLAGAAGEIPIPDAAAPASEARQRDLEAANRAGTGGAAAGDASKQQPVVRTARRVGRNDPCPCGSGKKFKKCCGAPSNAAAE